MDSSTGRGSHTHTHHKKPAEPAPEAAVADDTGTTLAPAPEAAVANDTGTTRKRSRRSRSRKTSPTVVEGPGAATEEDAASAADRKPHHKPHSRSRDLAIEADGGRGAGTVGGDTEGLQPQPADARPSSLQQSTDSALVMNQPGMPPLGGMVAPGMPPAFPPGAGFPPRMLPGVPRVRQAETPLFNPEFPPKMPPTRVIQQGVDQSANDVTGFTTTMAERKARAAFDAIMADVSNLHNSSHPPDMYIAMHTSVLLSKSKFLDVPTSPAQHREMLLDMMASRRLDIVTGICLLQPRGKDWYPPSHEEIDRIRDDASRKAYEQAKSEKHPGTAPNASESALAMIQKLRDAAADQAEQRAMDRFECVTAAESLRLGLRNELSGFNTDGIDAFMQTTGEPVNEMGGGFSLSGLFYLAFVKSSDGCSPAAIQFPMARILDMMGHKPLDLPPADWSGRQAWEDGRAEWRKANEERRQKQSARSRL